MREQTFNKHKFSFGKFSYEGTVRDPESDKRLHQTIRFGIFATLALGLAAIAFRERDVMKNIPVGLLQ